MKWSILKRAVRFAIWGVVLGIMPPPVGGQFAARSDAPSINTVQGSAFRPSTTRTATAHLSGLTNPLHSHNAVGYYKITLYGGRFHLLANQLNRGDNNINRIFPATTPLPDGVSLLTWAPAGQTFNAADTFFAGFGWLDENLEYSRTTLSPGEGAFLEMPPGPTIEITLVGEVPQGTLSLDLLPGFQIISNLIPAAEPIGIWACDGDSILFWHPLKLGTKKGGYVPDGAIVYFEGMGWIGPGFQVVEPIAEIGQAVLYQRSPGCANATWVREFHID